MLENNASLKTLQSKTLNLISKLYCIFTHNNYIVPYTSTHISVHSSKCSLFSIRQLQYSLICIWKDYWLSTNKPKVLNIKLEDFTLALNVLSILAVMLAGDNNWTTSLTSPYLVLRWTLAADTSQIDWSCCW